MGDPQDHYGQLSSMLDSFLVGVVTVSPDHRILSMNRSAAALCGVKENEILGNHCRDMFLHDLCGGECRFRDSLLSPPKPCPSSKSSSHRLKTVKGAANSSDTAGCAPYSPESRLSARLHGNPSITKRIAPLFGPDSSASGCVIFFQDHSAFKDLIDRVRHEDRQLKIILDNLDIGILTVDRGGHVTFFNNMAETITGYNREDILGRPSSMLFGKDSCQEISLLKETIEDGTARSREKGEIITREGRTVPIRSHHMALKREDGRILGGLTTILDLSLMYQLDSAIHERYTFYDIVGKDPAMQKIFDIIPVIAASDSTVLIEGPTGTGKDLLAKVIHNLSNRAGKSMVTVNCAALPDNLLESEMFGYLKGAFTGADRDKPGRFQEADGGTIFLDEIGELPLSLQAKLLQVLEDKEFYALGSRKTTKVDVRIIAATNQELERQAKEKRFREDLYYRLNVMSLRLPELKERRGDLPLLIYHILNRLSLTKNTKVKKISEDAMEVLLGYDYPGNIRELENILEYAVIICGGTAIESKHLPNSLLRYSSYEPPASRKNGEISHEEADEKELILATLKKYQWNRGMVANALNMDRTTLWRKMKKHHLF